LIIDPPDGKIPPYTPEGQRRLDAQNYALLNPLPEDRKDSRTTSDA